MAAFHLESMDRCTYQPGNRRTMSNPIQNLPPHQRQEFMRTLEELQVKDSLMMYNRLVERCFKQCVTRFRSKKMDDSELDCVSKCAEKYMKLTQRAGFRFAEFQASAGGAP